MHFSFVLTTSLMKRTLWDTSHSPSLFENDVSPESGLSECDAGADVTPGFRGEMSPALIAQVLDCHLINRSYGILIFELQETSTAVSSAERRHAKAYKK